MADRPHLLVYALRGGLEGAISAPNNGFLNPAIWSALPADVLEMVLLVLPRGVQHRFRVVCKKWLALLTSPKFLRLSESLAPRPAAPLVCGFEYWNGVEPETRMSSPNPNSLWTRSSFCESALGKAYRLDLSYLPQKFHNWFEMWSAADKRVVQLWRDSSSQICGSVGGLIYLLNEDIECELVGQRILSVCVLNPFTRTWRELPPLLIYTDWTYWTVKLEVDEPDGNGFRFTAVCGSCVVYTDLGAPFNWSVYVYSSAEGKTGWEVTMGQPSSEWCMFHVLAEGWIYGLAGDLMYGYLISTDRLTAHSLLDGRLVARDSDPSALERAFSLDERIGSASPTCVPTPSLLEHLGALYLVRAFVDPQEEWQIGIWKLDRDISAMQWELRSVFPRGLVEFREGTRESYLPVESFDAVVIGDEIFFMLPVRHRCCNAGPDVSSSLVAFNLRDDSWQLVTEKVIILNPASGRSHGLLEPKFNVWI